jgi:hypothetical protein
VKKQPKEWEKTFVNSSFNRGLISRIYKELKKGWGIAQVVEGLTNKLKS